MTAFGAIARAAITRRPSSGAAGVIIFIPVTTIIFSAAANDIVSGATIDIAASAIDFTAPANAPVGGTLIDIPFSQMSMTAAMNAAVGGASVDTRATRTAHRGMSIAGGAITRPPPVYSYLAGSQIVLTGHLNDAISGTLVDLESSTLTLTALPEEVIARTRAIRAISISS